MTENNQRNDRRDPESFTDSQLLAWVCGDLDATTSAQIESQLADSPSLLQRVFNDAELLTQIGTLPLTIATKNQPLCVRTRFPSNSDHSDANGLRLIEQDGSRRSVTWIRPKSAAWGARFVAFAALAVAVLIGAGVTFVVYSKSESRSINSWVVQLELAYADEVSAVPVPENQEDVGLAGDDAETSWMADARDEPLSWIAAAVRESQMVQE